MRALKALGVRVSLDDFGTGYSSLAYLLRFPFDKIKIDKSFVSSSGRHPHSMSIVQLITALARETGMTTTAEGMETLEQLEQMRAADCTEVQGYLISRPGPVEEVGR